MSRTQRTQQREGRKAPATAGLNDLDQDRAASVADEGGASAATLEAQESVEIAAPKRHPAPAHPRRGTVVAHSKP